MAAVSASETALLTLREHQIPNLGRKAKFPESRLQRLYERRELLLSHGILLGALAHLGAAICVLLLAPKWAYALGQPTVPVLLVVFVLLIGLFDGLPKMLALSHPGHILRFCSSPLLASEVVLRPLTTPMRKLAGAIADKLAPKGFAPLARIEDAELETLVEMRRDTGELPDWEAEVIHEIVKLGDKTAKDVMTPRVDVIAIDETSSREQIDAIVRSTSHRLLPVFRDSPDAIVGVLDVAIYLHEDGALAPATRNPVFVPETMAAEHLFGSHLGGPRDIAIVLDEHGGFEGIATASDIIEDLIRDAAPPIAGAEEIRRLEDGRLIASGAARLEDLEDELGTDLAVDGIDTIGGLLFTKAGELPPAGRSFKIGQHLATIRKLSGKRIEEVLIERQAQKGDRL